MFPPYSLLQKRLNVATNRETIELLLLVGTGVLDCPRKERNIHRRTARKNRFVSGRRGSETERLHPTHVGATIGLPFFAQSYSSVRGRSMIAPTTNNCVATPRDGDENRIVAGRRGRRPLRGGR